ncbi:unnamed protein product, partial [Brassica oleracea var. botrytis]
GLSINVKPSLDQKPDHIKMDSQQRSLCFISLAFLFITCSSAEFLIQQVTQGRGTENNSSSSLDANLGVTRVLRDERPSSKIVTIAGYSVIKGRGEPYESSVFEAAGYKWRLVLYVVGNANDGGAGYISLYVRIEETESLPFGWELNNVDLKLFVHNPKLNKYLTVTDGALKRFNGVKKELGFGQLIALSTFENTNEGYIVQDTCSFGAEILIVKPAEVQEKVTFISNPPDNVFTWKILRFSNLEDKFYYSADFLVGDRYWRLGFNPKGDGGGRPHALPIFLFAQGFGPNAVATNTWGAVNLRLKNQRSTNHRQIYSAAWYPIRSGYGVGVNNIILLADLNDASKGYLVNDAIIFEAEMVKVSVTNINSCYNTEIISVYYRLNITKKDNEQGTASRQVPSASAPSVARASAPSVPGASAPGTSTGCAPVVRKTLRVEFPDCISARHWTNNIHSPSHERVWLVLHVGNAGYISLYLRIEEAESIPYGLEVNVDLKLFVHVPKLDKYLTITDGAVKRFNTEKKEWGFEQLIDLASFENTNEGYIVQDTCSFGAEIFIVKPAKVQEKVTFISNPPRNVFTWEIPHFSDMGDKFYYSDDFLVGDRYWRLGFNPKSGSALPIYLYAQGFRPDAVTTNTWGAVNLRLKNQRSTNHRERYSWYPIRSDYGVGVNSIISLADLHDASKGYLVNDAIIFEAEMVKVTVTNIVSV